MLAKIAACLIVSCALGCAREKALYSEMVLDNSYANRLYDDERKLCLELSELEKELYQSGLIMIDNSSPTSRVFMVLEPWFTRDFDLVDNGVQYLGLNNALQQLVINFFDSGRVDRFSVRGSQKVIDFAAVDDAQAAMASDLRFEFELYRIKAHLSLRVITYFERDELQRWKIRRMIWHR